MHGALTRASAWEISRGNRAPTSTIIARTFSSTHCSSNVGVIMSAPDTGDLANPREERGDCSGTSAPQLQLLPSAKRAPLTVSREDSLRHAETQMLLNDYSQLPVMTGERTVHGLISWKSIGKAHVIGNAGRT